MISKLLIMVQDSIYHLPGMTVTTHELLDLHVTKPQVALSALHFFTYDPTPLTKQMGRVFTFSRLLPGLLC
jgi:hypothetical protein